MENNKEYFDVAVIGAGPAGMIAAGRAAELGARVILIEKNPKPGLKILITGKGRCNITNAEPNIRKFVEHYGKNGPFLYHAFSIFDNKEVVKFFEEKGLKTEIERGKRVFPVSDQAQDVINVLWRYLNENKVKTIFENEVLDIKKIGNRIEKIQLKDGAIFAKNYIICTGGKSYPGTGSTGTGFSFAKELGHKITELSPALVPIEISDKWVKELQGLSLKNIELKVLQDKKEKIKIFGEFLFTHFGVSGPIILDISKKIGELLKTGKVILSLDLKPALDFDILDQRLQRDFQKYSKKMFKNALDDLLPKKLIPVFIKMSGIHPEKATSAITREERHNLIKLLKGMKMMVSGLLGFENAIITTGGIDLKEVDHKTMKSKIIDNLFFAGEILDIDGPTGGFNLQICWSTGYLAGQSANKN